MATAVKPGSRVPPLPPAALDDVEEETRPDWVSPKVPYPDSPITGRQEILAYAGLLRWAHLDEAEILQQLLKQYGNGSITESDQSRPWSKQDFQKIASEMGRKPLTRLVPAPRMPIVTFRRRRAIVRVLS